MLGIKEQIRHPLDFMLRDSEWFSEQVMDFEIDYSILSYLLCDFWALQLLKDECGWNETKMMD